MFQHQYWFHQERIFEILRDERKITLVRFDDILYNRIIPIRDAANFVDLPNSATIYNINNTLIIHVYFNHLLSTANNY